MNQSIKFSVIIPVYNVERYLAQCVNSVVLQCYRNFEVILVDDGSSDQSGIICDQYAQKDSRVHVIHKQNGGLSDARNAGIQKATGEYLLFLDSDDFWSDSNVLMSIAKQLLKTRADVLCLNFCKTDGVCCGKPCLAIVSSVPDAQVSHDSFTYLIKNQLWTACAWNKVISANLFKNFDLLFRVGITSEDIDWCVRLALSTDSYDYHSAPVICYRQREGSISKATTITKTQVLFENIKECLRLLDHTKDCTKKELLMPYLAYQYATLLVHTAKIATAKDRKEMITKIQPNCYLLKYNNNAKVKLMKLTAKLGGLSLTVRLLRILSKLNLF